MRTVVHFTDSCGIGGAEHALLTLMAGLKSRGWRQALMYHTSPGIAPLIEGAARLDVGLWPVPRMPDGLLGARRVWAFSRQLSARRPDVFHAHLTWPLACKFGLAGAILARVPAIVATVQLYVEFPLDLSNFVQQRLIVAGVGRYVAVSQAVSERLTHKLRWPARKVQVIRNCISTLDFDPLRDRPVKRAGQPVVLTVARLDEQKGHRYLLKAAAQVPEAQFVFAGDGPLRASLEAQARSLGVEERVRFLGHRNDIPDLLADCDVFVLPSLYEGLPLSILEAMSASKPVIATQIGGTDEAVIAGETGLLIPPADPTALAAAIRTVLADKPLAQRLASAGRARVEQEFSAMKMVQQVIDVYAELLERHGASKVAIDRRDEATVNRIMRRADWRFLLPDPRPARSVCFAKDMLAQAVAAISDRVIDPAAHPVGDCDLAVALNPARQTLQAAWEALRPGGVCYTEWTSPLAGGPARIRRQLESIGFTESVCYWLWPRPDRNLTFYWLPVEAPHVVQYLLAHRTPGQTPLSRIWGRLLEGVWRMGLSLRLLAPLSMIARKPPAEEGTVLDLIRASWSSWSSAPAPLRLDWMLLTGGAKTINKVVGLVFAESEPSPRLIVKLARVGEAVAALDREAANLQAVRALRPDQVGGVPQVLFSHEWAGQTVLGENALSGRPLYTLLRQDTYRDLALKVTEWLANLAGHSPPCARSEWWGRLVETTVAKFERSLGRALDPAKLQATRTMLASLGDLPIVCEQRDCSPWNIFIASDGDLVILDWESAEPRGLPILDLVYFLTYLNFFLDGAMDSRRFRESYRAALDPATFTGRVVAECQQRYLARVGLDPEVLRPLRLLTWLIHFQSESQELGGRIRRSARSNRFSAQPVFEFMGRGAVVCRRKREPQRRELKGWWSRVGLAGDFRSKPGETKNSDQPPTQFAHYLLAQSS